MVEVTDRRDVWVGLKPNRKITSEPWPSMQRRKKTEKNEREKLFSVTRGSVLKKSLTGPTLLEMYSVLGMKYARSGFKWLLVPSHKHKESDCLR